MHSFGKYALGSKMAPYIFIAHPIQVAGPKLLWSPLISWFWSLFSAYIQDFSFTPSPNTFWSSFLPLSYQYTILPCIPPPLWAYLFPSSTPKTWSVRASANKSLIFCERNLNANPRNEEQDYKKWSISDHTLLEKKSDADMSEGIGNWKRIFNPYPRQLSSIVEKKPLLHAHCGKNVTVKSPISAPGAFEVRIKCLPLFRVILPCFHWKPYSFLLFLCNW